MAEQSTYVIFPRDFYKWRWYKEPRTVHLYVYLIMSARTERGGYRTVTIERGQLFTTLERISEETGLSVAEVRTGINRLTRTGEIKCETYPFGRLITVTDFEQFMEDDA